MMPWIRAAAKAIRTEHDRSPARIAVERDVGESTVRRFEKGQTINIDIDSMIAAYARVIELPAIEFWQRALEMWQASLRGASKP